MGSEWILGGLAEGCGVDSVGSGQEPVVGCCEHGDEPSVSGATKLLITAWDLKIIHHTLFSQLKSRTMDWHVTIASDG
jgi:hypothetical protein